MFWVCELWATLSARFLFFEWLVAEGRTQKLGRRLRLQWCTGSLYRDGRKVSTGGQLGSITADVSTADCYSYAKDEDWSSNLAQLLGKRGIHVGAMYVSKFVKRNVMGLISHWFFLVSLVQAKTGSSDPRFKWNSMLPSMPFMLLPRLVLNCCHCPDLVYKDYKTWETRATCTLLFSFGLVEPSRNWQDATELTRILPNKRSWHQCHPRRLLPNSCVKLQSCLVPWWSSWAFAMQRRRIATSGAFAMQRRRIATSRAFAMYSEGVLRERKYIVCSLQELKHIEWQ